MSRQHLLQTVATAALLTTAIFAAPAQAQSTEASGATQLQEVVVTATRRSESLQSVPLSITAIGADEIHQTGSVRFNDLSYSVPNVAILENSGAPSFTNVSIRGVNGRAGIYVDDVPIGESSGFNTYLIDVDRVEVLRGPQGTLFGNNTLAGTIHTLTRKPGKTFEAEGLLSAGDYGQVNVAGMVSGPLISDKLAGSIAATYRDRDGFAKIRGGGRGNDDNGFGARAKLRFTPNERLDVVLSVDTDYTNVSPYYYKLTHQLTAGAGPVALDPDIHNDIVEGGPQTNKSSRRIYGGSLNATYDLGGLTLTSVTASRRTKYALSRDGDYSALDRLYLSLNSTFQQTSQEFRIASPDKGRFTWIAGAFYFWTKSKVGGQTLVGPDYDAGGVTVGQLQALGLAPKPYIIPSAASTNTDTSYALYGSGAYEITPQLKLRGGLRYTREKIETKIIPAQSFSTTDDNLSPSLSLTYQPADDINLYGTVSQGWYRGGFNTQPTIVIGERAFKPEKLTNYELGVKSYWFDRRLLANAAVFYMDYSNLQRSQSFLINGAQVSTTTNAASTTIKGFEIELQARPIPGLSLTARSGYQDAKYDSYANAPTFTATGPQILNLSGTALPFAPKYSASLIGRYEWPIVSGLRAWVGGDVGYKSRYQLNSGPLSIVPFFVVEDSTLVNLNLGVETEDGRWSLGLYGRNITDERYKTGLDITTIKGANIEADQFSDPSTYLVEARFKF